MDSLKIDTGEKRIAINDDPERVIVFNPQDIGFAERFYELLRDFEAKQAEYQARSELLDNDETDEHGLPVNIGESLSLMREVCEFLNSKIDYLFGEGASQKIFGGAMTLDMYAQFFTGITPFIQVARQGKTAKYAPPGKQPRAKRVMK